MAAPSPDEAVRTLQEGHTEVLRLLQGTSEDDLERERTIGGGDWSAKDLVGHLATWEELALQTLAEWRLGRRPEVEDVYGDPGGVDRYNDRTVAAKRTRPVHEVLRLAAETHARLVNELVAISEEEWRAKAPYPTERRRRLGELLGSILGAPRRPFGHAFAHLPDLEAYVTALPG